MMTSNWASQNRSAHRRNENVYGFLGSMIKQEFSVQVAFLSRDET